MIPSVYLLGTADTKFAELDYLRSVLTGRGVGSHIVDVGTREDPCAADITARQVAACHPDGAAAVFCGERGRAIAAMSEALRRFLPGRADLAGVIAIGGSGGTALVAPALQDLPIGLPKILVSTVASGNVAPYVGESDLSMVYSVVDLQGLNRISRTILANAANAMAGMVLHPAPHDAGTRPAVGITMFGVTTPCVTEAMHILTGDFECLVFHATGTGGRSMERLVRQGMIGGVLDITTTEFCDFVAGGIFPCEAGRLDAVAATGVPYVGSCGGLDMVNFGARDTVPDRYRDRVFVQHNPFITLMRTTAEECGQMGRLIGARLNRCHGPVRFYYPEKGFSQLDRPGQPFHDPAADAAFRDALASTLEQTDRRRFISLPLALNDPAFAQAMVTEFRTLFKESHPHAPH
ncbi:Tm-1-like ATP-binding domain-containing protein [Gluconacetobacter diazotrophicus]|nr:Tm-1-like ATP-binding domain-containing protein [Gluconacetobacter diazotrophicus]